MQISNRSNTTAAQTARKANYASDETKKSMERLASGLRINRAADDAAGMSIAAQMTAELNGLFQASRNARDAVSLVQTAEGGLSEVGGALDRMRTLAVQSASDVLGTSERAAIQKEVNQLQSEISRTAGAVEFNGKKLLDGSFQGARFQVGPNAGQEVNISIQGLQAPNVDLTSFDGASQAITSLDGAIRSVNDQRATLGATQNRLESTIRNLDSTAENTLASRSRIEDADVARESAERARTEVMTRGAIAILAQANTMPGMAARLLG
jgi:flagellin